MKRKQVLTFTFLLMLYIVPSLFTMTYGPATIPAQQNSTKEFSVSATGDESSQSITSFSETLADDVLFYPDSFTSTSINTSMPRVGDGGEDDWIDSTTNTGVGVDDAWIVFISSGTASEEIYFKTPGCFVESFSYACYSYAYAGTGSLDYYNGSDWVVLDSFTTSYPPKWKNGTYQFSLEGNQTYLELRQTCTGGLFPESRIFYLEISFTYMIQETATSGDDDYADSQLLDSVYWETSNIEVANFTFDGTIESFDYHCYGSETDAYSTLLQFHNGTSWVTLETFTTTYSWYNDTVSTSVIGTVQLRINTNSADTTIQVDYLRLSFIGMTLADSEHYAESFADVSDWTYYTPDGSDSFSSGGDYATMVNDWAGGSTGGVDTDYIYTNTPKGSFQYYEIRYRLNDSSVGSLVLATYPSDDLGGSATLYQGLTKSTTWTTQKIMDTDSIECIALMLQTTNVSGDAELYVDYLRASPANESGWQYDGSTTAPISNSTTADMTHSFSSDGDILTYNMTYDGAIGANGDLFIYYDTTSTQIDLESTYYPFVGVRYKGSRSSSMLQTHITLRSYYDSLLVTYVPVLDGSWHTLRWNHAVGSSQVHNYFKIYCYANEPTDTFEIEIDYVKAYSIANWTVTQGALTTSDIIYVDSGSLNFERTTASYFILDYDPSLSFSTAEFTYWNLTISNIGSDVASTYDWRPRFYVDAVWQDSADDNDMTSGGFDDTLGICTDVQFVNYESLILTAIKFIDGHDWHEVDTVTVYFVVPYDYWAFNMFLMLFGLVIVVVSACYLAFTIRNQTTDRNIFMLFLFVFMLGWGLFLGGALLG